jgi:hypothetical protein
VAHSPGLHKVATRLGRGLGGHLGFASGETVCHQLHFPLDGPLAALCRGFDRADVIPFCQVTRKVEAWGAKCYEATVKYIDPPILTEKMLRDHLARFIAHAGFEER